MRMCVHYGSPGSDIISETEPWAYAERVLQDVSLSITALL